MIQCKLQTANCYVLEVALYRKQGLQISGYRRATLEIPVSVSTFSSISMISWLFDSNKIEMTLQCLVPEVQIWRLPNRKPLHWRHSVGVSPVRLRTHWTIKLVVGTLKLGKERKLQYSVHFRSFTYFCVVAFTSLPYCFFIQLSYCPICSYFRFGGSYIYFRFSQTQCELYIDLHDLENMRKVDEITFSGDLELET